MKAKLQILSAAALTCTIIYLMLYTSDWWACALWAFGFFIGRRCKYSQGRLNHRDVVMTLWGVAYIFLAATFCWTYDYKYCSALETIRAMADGSYDANTPPAIERIPTKE